MPKRKGGGQPGNTNALKSGFYSPRFTSTLLVYPLKQRRRVDDRRMSYVDNFIITKPD
jgi:hypothetical protein